MKAWLAEKHQVTFTGDPDWLPFEAFEDDGNYIGIVAECLHQLEAELPLTIQTIPVNTFQEAQMRSRDGDIDLISGDIDDIVLSHNYDPITPYIVTPIVIVMRDDQDFVSDLPDIADLKIAISRTAGFSSQVYENYPDVPLIGVTGNSEGLEGLTIGKYDAMVLSLPRAGYTIRTKGYNNLKVVGKTNVDTKVTLFVTKKKPMLRMAINQAMIEIPRTRHQEIL